MHKYEEIMDKVYMTENMQERILKNIRKTMREAPDEIVPRRKNERLISAFCLVAAACLIVIALYQINPLRISERELQSQKADRQNSGQMQAVWNVTECSSIEELSDKVGFKVSEIDTATIPFKINTVSYLAYPDKLAEIKYSGNADEQVSYRESTGSEDISGDYNSYQQIDTIKVLNIEIVLKGENGIYKTAVWQNEGHSYSLGISAGADKRTWEKILMSVK